MFPGTINGSLASQFAYQYSAGSLAHLYLLRTQRSSLEDMVENYYIDLAELERENIGDGQIGHSSRIRSFKFTSFWFTSEGVVKIRNSMHKDSLDALDETCNCYTCKNFSRSYLHHLDKNHNL